MMKSGVYLIYNPINGKRYIGSSIDIIRRLKEHRRNLIALRHHNLHLLNAWNKYGDSLEFKPLEYCEPDRLLDLELQYIDYYDSANREFGYNIDAIADHARPGFHLSEETKQKISYANKGRKLSSEAIEKMKLVQTGKPKPKLSLTMKQKYANGQSTFPRYNEVSKDKQELWSKHQSEACKRRYSNYANRAKGYFLKVEIDDEVLYFPSLRETARQLGVDKGGVSYVLKHTNGYMKKLNCYISYITEEEFMLTEFYRENYKANKVSGEK